MSDSEVDESNLPSSAECEERCQTFAQMTGTDTALAMFYLQDREWDVQRALDAYFEEQVPGAHGADVTGKQTAAKASEPEDPEPNRVRLMSWNIDGLDKGNLKSRTTAVANKIKQEKPDVVFLQEVIPNSLELLEELCPDYQAIPGNNRSYFTAILLKCSTVQYDDHSVIPFYSSTMGRNLLHAKACVKGVKVDLFTAHLESTKSHATERKKQLKISFQNILESPADSTVLFGGDLNLRDEEVGKVGLPENIVDLWEVTGKRPEAKYTFDLTRNDNLDMGFRPRCRFDRLYIRHCKPKPTIKPVYFELVGLERLPDCKRFASDHWGLLAHFDKV